MCSRLYPQGLVRRCPIRVCQVSELLASVKRTRYLPFQRLLRSFAKQLFVPQIDGNLSDPHWLLSSCGEAIVVCHRALPLAFIG